MIKKIPLKPEPKQLPFGKLELDCIFLSKISIGKSKSRGAFDTSIESKLKFFAF